MSGVTAFISRIEYMTPSGSPPNKRIRTTSTPTPRPKIQAPLGVSGVVTYLCAFIVRVPPNSDSWLITALILFFVLIDGWNLLVGSMVRSFIS